MVGGKEWNAKGDKFTYCMFPKSRPKRIDWMREGKVQQGIYELDGDTLRLCLGNLGEPRPTEFDTTAGDGRSLHVRRRVEASGEGK